MHSLKNTNEFIRGMHKRVSLVSKELIMDVIRANDYLIKYKGISQRQQAREINKQGLRIGENTYYALKRGSYNCINTLFLSILCSYWGLTIFDMLLIGRELKGGDTPELSRFGL